MPPKLNEISVIMPVYNSAGYVAYSIKSILNQTFRDFEFIIINDGSTDNSEEEILKFGDSRIKYFKTAHKGTSGALNYGIAKAKNSWIARIDSDDLNTPDRLEKQIWYINDNPQTDILSSWSVYFNNNNKILFFLNPASGHRQITEMMRLHNPINQSGLVIRKSLLKKNKYNESLLYNEDFELMFRLRDSAVFHIIPEYLVYTRFGSTSKSFSGRKANVYDFLFPPAFKLLLEAKGKGDHFIWSTAIAWINFFYGNRKASRSYFKKSVSLKNTIAYLATYLPEKSFEKLVNYRFKYRFKALFMAKKNFYSELTKLLS